MLNNLYIKLSFLFLFTFSIFSDDIYFPTKNWDVVHPNEFSIDKDKVDRLIDIAFKDNSTQGVVIIKNGKIIGEKYADGYNFSSHGTSWSMAKSYYAALIGISIDKGEINSLDDKVATYLEYNNDER